MKQCINKILYVPMHGHYDTIIRGDIIEEKN